MRRRNWFLLLAVLCVAGLLLALVSCSGGRKQGTADRASSAPPSSNSTNGPDDTAAVCEFLLKIDQAASNARSPQEGLQLLASLQSEIDATLTAAPPSVRRDLGIIAEASRKAVDSQDLGLMATDQVAQAGAELSSQCSLKATQQAGSSSH